MIKYLPYIISATFIHGLTFFLLFTSPLPKKPLSPIAFQEKLVTLKPKTPVNTLPPKTLSPIIMPSSITKTTQQDSKPSSQEILPTPLKQPIPKTISKESPKKLETSPVAKTQPPPKTPVTQISQTQLKALSDVAQALASHVDKIEKSDAALKDIAWTPTTQLTINSELETPQEEELCKLFQTYVVLPCTGYIRIKLVLAPNGNIEECVFLSDVSASDQQLLSKRIQAIPFQKFLEKYKVSKNISFHIKLLSNES
ncbi:hypothetical protein C10C_0754 [Chlamydia serpentis]|uniref:Uncharacterized protein n=1 Tax=Chlamydia serpentis TaxID=1967782 RepID=A0A2R8FCB2_9CHLA|nr:inclusion-associated protein [Chlamydia serpentis]SPN73897.1 hypothetical protein C10C_0754 [Chlamydia serpentis]